MSRPESTCRLVSHPTPAEKHRCALPNRRERKTMGVEPGTVVACLCGLKWKWADVSAWSEGFASWGWERVYDFKNP